VCWLQRSAMHGRAILHLSLPSMQSVTGLASLIRCQTVVCHACFGMV